MSTQNVLKSLLVPMVHPNTKRIVAENLEDTKRVYALSSLIVEVALNAFTHFNNRQFIQFDALVGEAQCHLRAYKIVQLRLTGVEDRIGQLEEVEQKLLGLHLTDESQEGPFLEVVKEVGDGRKALDSNELFLVASHLLFVVRGKEDSASSVAENLLDYAPHQVADSLIAQDVKDLMFQAKEYLAKETVRFVQEIAAKDLKPFVTGSNVLMQSQMSRISCYMGMKIVLNHMSLNDEPILFKITNPNSGEQFDLVYPSGRPLSDRVVMVIECDSSLKHDEIIALDIPSMILANGAQHYQYFSKNDVEIPQFRLVEFKSLVKANTLLLNNPSNAMAVLSQDELRHLNDIFKTKCSALYKSRGSMLQTFLEMENHKIQPLSFVIRHIYAGVHS